MATTDEKLDRITMLVEHLMDDMQMIRTEMKEMRSELKEFREENAKEHDLLRGQIGAVAEALNTTIAINDAEYGELKDKTNTLERMQKQHSLDIMELRAAI